MEKFVLPEIEIIKVEEDDIIATSAGELHYNRMEAEEERF